MIEIEPLLAYQFIVDTDRSAALSGNLTSPPRLDELFALCLPTTPPNEPLSLTPIVPGSQSLMITSGLNVRIQNIGYFQNVAVAGVLVAPALPFAHVTRCNGQCFLHNGFHRAYGARKAGATHIPCLLRDVPNLETAGVRSDGATFGPAAFQSGNSPTVGHFTQEGGAFPVLARQFKRVIHVSWAEYGVPAE
jgi:hypothetical protein